MKHSEFARAVDDEFGALGRALVRDLVLDSLGVSTTPAVALPQIAPLDPAEAEVSDSDWEAESSDSEAEMPPLPHETATSVASTM
jgi:hypothetical protein